jgi:hypothetical protein
MSGSVTSASTNLRIEPMQMRTNQSNMLCGRRPACRLSNQQKFAAILSFIACAGCGAKDRFEIAPVSGTITLNDRPLGNARIGFEPVASTGSLAGGSGSYATTDTQGNFHLSTVAGKEGAVVGRHRVWIRAIRLDATGKVTSKESLPREYNDDTTLTFEVPAGGTQKADFSLTAKSDL